MGDIEFHNARMHCARTLYEHLAMRINPTLYEGVVVAAAATPRPPRYHQLKYYSKLCLDPRKTINFPYFFRSRVFLQYKYSNLGLEKPLQLLLKKHITAGGPLHGIPLKITFCPSLKKVCLRA